MQDIIVVLVNGKPYKLVPMDETSITKKTPLAEVLSGSGLGAAKQAGFEYLEQFLSVTEAEILRIPNLGRKTLNMIREELATRYAMRPGQLKDFESPKRE